MKKLLLMIFVSTLLISYVDAQTVKLIRTIQATGTMEDNGAIIEVSSDDAEQENDAMDDLEDDDIDTGWEGEADDQNILTAGLRFRDIFIPQGATIDSAYIMVWSHEAKTAEDVARITISCEATDDAETFTLDALITDRPTTDASVLWEVAEPWEIWQPYRTPDLKDIIQEVVNRDGWKENNSLAFILAGEDQGPSELENAREFESFENIEDPEDGGDGQNHPERRPQLVVYYNARTSLHTLHIPIIATGSIIEDGEEFAVSSDDAEQENDSMDDLEDDDIDTGWEGEADDQNILTAGLRFQNIFFPCLPPQDSFVVDSAYIVVNSHEAKTAEDVARITIVGQADDNAPTFTLDALITDRPETNASVLWEVAEPWELWGYYRTPDLAEIVTEVITRDGWINGNPIAFFLKGEDQGPSELENAREFESFENISDPEDGGDGQRHQERIPLLVIKYSLNCTVGVDDFSNNVQSLKIYPNPSNGSLINVEFLEDAASTIQIFNVQGQLIQTNQFDNGKTITLNISQLAPGQYFVRAKQANGVFLQKLTVTN